MALIALTQHELIYIAQQYYSTDREEVTSLSIDALVSRTRNLQRFISLVPCVAGIYVLKAEKDTIYGFGKKGGWIYFLEPIFKISIREFSKVIKSNGFQPVKRPAKYMLRG